MAEQRYFAKLLGRYEEDGKAYVKLRQLRKKEGSEAEKLRISLDELAKQALLEAEYALVIEEQGSYALFLAKKKRGLTGLLERLLGKSLLKTRNLHKLPLYLAKSSNPDDRERIIPGYSLISVVGEGYWYEKYNQKKR